MVIMKFGGTSVEDASAMSKVASIVHTALKRSVEEGSPAPMVIISACAGITNKLFELSKLAAAGKESEALKIFGIIRDHHLKIIENLVTDPTRKSLVTEKIIKLLSELDQLVRAVIYLGELTPRLEDAFASFGELLSSTVLGEALNQNGIFTEWLDARHLLKTDSNFGKAVPLWPLVEKQIQEKVYPLLKRGTVVLSQGYIGSTEQGKTTTLGRGGSDYSAAIFGAALGVDAIQIWTDVDGVLTTDPRVVAGARRLKVMTFSEAAELAYFGAKVLHPSTIRPAIQKNIPVYVLNSKRPESEGTRISNEVDSHEGTVKSIACKKGQTMINLTTTSMLGEYGFLYKVSEIFAEYETPIDMISTSEVSISVTIGITTNLDLIIERLKKIADVSIDRGVAIVCVVGDSIRKSPGIASRVFSSLPSINVKMISQGASEINIGFVVDEKDADTAVRLLHDEFFSAIRENAIFA
ncbi:MAG: lysine-sensitive aspartokinase 3 [Chloroherpetonaceae bacterium]|nr:lysine-sensitive aspartokinase 3 [Chloroherpetonaceae bacterium]